MTVNLPNGNKLTLPPQQFALIGRPSSGKSHFVASLPKPLWVAAFDPFAKMQPYFDKGIVDTQTYTGQFGQPIRLVKSPKTGDVIIQLEGFFDTEPGMPMAYQAFDSRLQQLKEEVKAGKWASAGFDSWSQLEYIARQRRTYGAFSTAATTGNKDGRAVYASAKDDLQQILTSRIIPLTCNVALTFHIEEKMSEEAGTMLYSVKAIGALKSDIGSLISERYHCINLDGTMRQLDTRDPRFDCCTLLDAPNPCPNSYEALWKNYIDKQIKLAAMVPPVAAEVTPLPSVPKE